MFGRVVTLGDAAFVASLHVVAGTTKVALDAQCLADAPPRRATMSKRR